MNHYIYVPYCPMVYSYQPSPEHRDFYPLNIYCSAPHSYYDYRADCNDAARINATMDYVNHNLQNQGFAGGTPNFHQARRSDGELVHGTVMFKRDAVDARDANKSDFGDIDHRDVGAMMRAADSYAGKNGYAAGIPTFHIGQNVYGVVLFKPGTAEVKDVLAKDLGNPGDIGSRFRAVSSYAGRLGYAAAFPNFHQARRSDGELVYGVVFIKSGNSEVRDVVAKDLDLPRYEGIFCGTGQETPPKKFPITTNQHTELGDHRRMETSIIVSSDGSVYGRTKTWTSKKWQGFTGHVHVVFLKANNEFVDSTPTFQYGVSGTATGGHKREEPWRYQIPREKINDVDKAIIYHSVRPTPRITPQNFKEWADVLVPLIKELKPTPQTPGIRYYSPYFPYFNYPFYTAPVYPETNHQVDRNIFRKEKGIPFKNFLTPKSTSTDMATPGGTSTDMATPKSTSTDMATPKSTSTDMATPKSTSTDMATPKSTSTDMATPGGTSTDMATPKSTSTDMATPGGTSTGTTIPWIPFSNTMSPSISSKDGPYGDITKMVESTNKFK
jgi:hypothetical protein